MPTEGFCSGCALVLAATILATLALILLGGRCGAGGKEGFLINFSYSPSCGSDWDGRRYSGCRGLTTGVMPSIETTNYDGNGLCGGWLGVPP